MIFQSKENDQKYKYFESIKNVKDENLKKKKKRRDWLVEKGGILNNYKPKIPFIIFNLIRLM